MIVDLGIIDNSLLVTTQAWAPLVWAVIASTAATAYSADHARITAKKQHNETMEAQATAEDNAKAYDLQEGIDAGASESATTDYGVDPKKKKLKTANNLLVKQSSATGSSLGLGFEY